MLIVFDVEAIKINNSLIEKNVGILLIKLSLPAITGMIIYSGLSLADTFFIAKLGPDSMAALTFCIPVLILISSVASSAGIGITSLIARTLGSGDVSFADNVAWHGLIMSCVYGLVIIIAGNRRCDDLLILFGSTPETFDLSRQYLKMVFWGCTFTFIPICMSSIIQGEGNILLPMAVSLAGIALNVALDPIFIFGFGPITALGLKGAAIASVLSQVISSVLIILFAVKKRGLITWRFYNFKPSIKVVGGICAVGLPAMIMDIAGIIVMAYLNKLLATFGYTAIAVLGIFIRIRSLVYMPVYGLAQGAMPIASFAYGAKNNDRVKETLIKASVLALIFVGIGWIVIQTYPIQIFRFFSNDPVLVSIGSTCLWVSTLVLPLMGPLVILYTVLQAVGKGTNVMLLSILRQFGFFLPLLIILPDYFGLNGVWMAFSLSELAGAILALFF